MLLPTQLICWNRSAGCSLHHETGHVSASLTVVSTKQAEFLQEQIEGAYTTYQCSASGTGDYIWVSRNFPLKFHLKRECLDQLFDLLSWMRKFCFKTVWSWLFCCWEHPEVSLTNTKAEGYRKQLRVLHKLWPLPSPSSILHPGFTCPFSEKQSSKAIVSWLAMDLHLLWCLIRLFLQLKQSECVCAHLSLSCSFWWVARVEPALQLSFQQELESLSSLSGFLFSWYL